MILLSISIGAAIATSGVEIAFSILIQSFFVSLGILGREVAALPSWAPDTFVTSVICLLVFAGFRSALQWFKAFANSMSMECFTVHMRELIAKWAFFHSSWDSSRVVTLATDRVNVSATSISAAQNLFVQTVTGSVIFVFLVLRSWQLALLGVGMLAVLGLLLRGADRFVRAEGERVAQLTSLYNARFLNGLRNLQFLRVSRFEGREGDLVAKTLTQYIRANKVYVSILAMKYATPQLLGAVIVVVITVIGRKYALLQPGFFLSFIYLFIRLAQGISEFSTSAAGIKMYLPQSRELYGWYANEYRPAPPQGGPVSTATLAPASWDVQSLGVVLGGKKILQGYSLHVPPGKITVLKGPSGSGKSTVLATLAGVLAPSSGHVFVSGSSLPIEDEVKTGRLRFGFVGPEPAVIGGSILENIQFGLDAPVDPAELQRMLELTSCAEFVKRHGLEHKITDRGEGLSTGQKQRLCLARALLRRPNALLLDEPTANLDEASKESIRQALLSLRGQTTIVIATHDESLAGIADQLVQMHSVSHA